MSSTAGNSVVNCGLDGCPLVTKFLCNGCQLTRYCSQDHQKSDWRRHKKVCSPLTLQISTELGRHYVATRNLKAGTLLVSECPLLVEPLVFQEEFDDEEDLPIGTAELVGSQVVCLSCCTPAEGKKCPKCDWPICSIECSEAKIHADHECPVFVKNSFKVDLMDRDTLVGVFLIRGLLLKKSQPESWAKIEDCQFESSSKTISDQEKEAFSKIVSRFQEIFKTLEKDFGENFVNIEVLVKLCGIQNYNAFISNFNHEEKPGKTTFARILYLKSSLFSHACFPNCSWGVTCGPIFKMEVRTAVDIVKGQILSITYGPKDSLMGSVKRNIDELKKGNFNCLCARCLDPTELNSMMSAVKCTKGDCTEGYLIPKDPKNFSSFSIWACTICGDHSTETWERINYLTNRAENMTKKFTDFEEPKMIEDLLIILRKNLHPNHWVIQEFCREVARELLDDIIIYRIADGETIDYYIEIAKYIVQVSQLTMPGLSYYKSDFHQMLVLGLQEKFQSIIVNDMSHRDQIIVELAREMSEILGQILKVKKLDPTSRTNDGKLNPKILKFMDCSLQLVRFLRLRFGSLIIIDGE